MNAVDTVKKLYELYAGGDIEGALSLCAPEACFTWNADPGYTRFCGTGSGSINFVRGFSFCKTSSTTIPSGWSRFSATAASALLPLQR